MGDLTAMLSAMQRGDPLDPSVVAFLVGLLPMLS